MFTGRTVPPVAGLPVAEERAECPSPPNPSPIRTILSANPIILDVTLREQIEWPDELEVDCFLSLACALLKILRGGRRVGAKSSSDLMEVL
jgi:hypothetical protein